MTRQRRNRILLWIIVLGLANFVSYTVTYWYYQGDAKNGAVVDGKYYLRGHFIRDRAGRMTDDVSRATWIYSFVHSVSIWPTVGAVLVAMFILARPHIIATMKADAMIRGPTFITVCITIIVLVSGASTFYFILSFINALVMIGRGQNWGI
jgi:hypothetical protein